MRTRNVLRLEKGNGQAKIVEEEAEDKNNQKNSFSSAISFASDLGLTVAIPIAGGAFLGQFLDNKFGTVPKLTLSFIIIGIFLATGGIYFRLRDVIEK